MKLDGLLMRSRFGFGSEKRYNRFQNFKSVPVKFRSVIDGLTLSIQLKFLTTSFLNSSVVFRLAVVAVVPLNEVVAHSKGD